MNQSVCAIAGFGAGVSMAVAKAFANLVSLAIGKSSLRSLAFCLAQELKESGIHVGTVTICGTVEPNTHFDPDAIAQFYIALHRQLPDSFEVEAIYQ